MPNFRIYYVERRPHDMDYIRALGRVGDKERVPHDYETEWEVDVEAKNQREALQVFFEEHLQGASNLGYIDEDGRTQRLFRMEDYDPDRTYVWTEGDKVVEYQGIEQIEGDLVPCPLCGGSGEVNRDIAEQFEEIEEEGEEYER